MKRPRRPFEETTVSAPQSRADIRDLLLRYGAEQFGFMEGPGQALIGFSAQGRVVRIEIPLPDRQVGATSPAGKFHRAGSAAAKKLHDQEERRIWRAARVWIFAQLEAIASGIRTFEEAFLADTVLPNGERFSAWAEPQMEEEAREGRMPHRLSITAIQNPHLPKDH